MENRFDVDSHGTLKAASAQSSSLLSPRVGSWVMAHTSPDWLLFVRTPAIGGVTEARPRVVLAGDCGTFPLSDLIGFLGQSRWTGVMRVITPGVERALALKDGEVRWATSDAAFERIGEVMVRFGYLTRGKLDEVLRDTPPSRVGRALVERNILQAHDLWKCLTEQVSEIFHAIMLCKEGSFALIDQDVDDKTMHSLSLSMQSLLMDSIRKIDEMAHFRKRIRHGRLYVAKKRSSDGTLQPEEDHLLTLANGQMTVLELGQAAKLSEFDATRIVYRLLEGGYAQVSDAAAHGAVEARAQTPAAKREAEVLDEKKIINVFNFIFCEIRNEVAKRGKLDTFMSSANAALKSSGLSPVPLLYGMTFQDDGSLGENALLSSYDKLKPQLGSEPLASLKQALSDVMFFLLFQAGELLESRADEDLARRVKEMLATLEL